jgi:hypothetical protein
VEKISKNFEKRLGGKNNAVFNTDSGRLVDCGDAKKIFFLSVDVFGKLQVAWPEEIPSKARHFVP